MCIVWYYILVSMNELIDNANVYATETNINVKIFTKLILADILKTVNILLFLCMSYSTV